MDHDGGETQASKELYSDKRIQDILIASYDISQQNAGVQRNILLWIGQEHPDWRMSEETKERINSSVLAEVQQMLGASTAEGGYPHAQIPALAIEMDVKRQVNNLQGVLNQDRDEIDNQFNVSVVQNGLVERDHKFLSRKAARIVRISENADPLTPLNDPHFSYISYYVLERNKYISPNKVSIPEYDALFQEIELHTRIQMNYHYKSGIHTENTNKLAFVIETYKETHPQNTIQIPVLEAQE